MTYLLQICVDCPQLTITILMVHVAHFIFSNFLIANMYLAGS